MPAVPGPIWLGPEGRSWVRDTAGKLEHDNEGPRAGRWCLFRVRWDLSCKEGVRGTGHVINQPSPLLE